MKKVDKLPDSALSPDFLEGVRGIVSEVYKNVYPKRIFGKSINGPAFVSLIESYLRSINTGAVPKISDSWISVAREENERVQREVMDKMKDIVTEKMRQLPMEPQDLANSIDKILKEATDYFHQHAVEYKKDIFITQISERMKEFHDQAIIKNNQLSKQFCEELLRKLTEQYFSGKRFNEVKEIFSTWSNLEVEYFKVAKGASKHEQLKTSMFSKLLEVITDFYKQVSKRYEELIQAEIKIQNGLREVIEKNKEEIHRSQLEYQQVTSQLHIQQERSKQLEADKSYLNLQLKDEKSRYKDLEATHYSLVNSHQEKMKEISDKNEKLGELKAALSENQNNQKLLHRDIQDRDSVIKQKLEELDKLKSDIKRESNNLNQEIRSLNAQKKSLEDELDKTNKQWKNDDAAFEHEKMILESHLKDLERKNSSTQEESSMIKSNLDEIAKNKQSTENELKNTKDQCKKLKSEIESNLEVIRKLKAELNSLQSETSSLKATDELNKNLHTTETQKLHQRIKQLEQKLTEEHDLKKNLATHNQQLEDTKVTKENELKKALREIKSLNNRKEELESSLTQKSDNAERFNRRISELERELKTKTDGSRDLERQVEDLKRQVEDLKRKSEETASNITTLKSKNRELTVNIGTLESELDRKKDEVDKLKNNVVSIEKEKDKIQEQEEELKKKFSSQIQSVTLEKERETEALKEKVKKLEVEKALPVVQLISTPTKNILRVEGDNEDSTSAIEGQTESTKSTRKIVKRSSTAKTQKRSASLAPAKSTPKTRGTKRRASEMTSSSPTSDETPSSKRRKIELKKDLEKHTINELKKLMTENRKEEYLPVTQARKDVYIALVREHLLNEGTDENINEESEMDE
eukprot:TRINITY_DN7416_c0_g1_i3.p1 TRINITY_DN7416_c0_g1~~TRINITY_DN7416_c0_g1_i3.p1  ORF type:complete len:867 (-),score=212.68 TRINITY_DN7416_c0_g1_i3:144-2744(-)